MSSDELTGSHPTITKDTTNITQTDINQNTSPSHSLNESPGENVENLQISRAEEENAGSDTSDCVMVAEEKISSELGIFSKTDKDTNLQNDYEVFNDVPCEENESKDNKNEKQTDSNEVENDANSIEILKNPVLIENDQLQTTDKEDEKLFDGNNTENIIFNEIKKKKQESNVNSLQINTDTNKMDALCHEESNAKDQPLNINNGINDKSQDDDSSINKKNNFSSQKFNRKEIFLNEPETKVKVEKKIHKPIVRIFSGKQKIEGRTQQNSNYQPIPQQYNPMMYKNNLNPEQSSFLPNTNISNVIHQNPPGFNFPNMSYYHTPPIYPMYNPQISYYPLPQFVPVPQKQIQPVQVKNEFQRIPIPIVSNKPEETVQSKPVNKKANDKFLIKCVCDEQNQDGLLIRCKECHSYLHAICVNEPKKRDDFICPFCSGRKIRCICKKDRNYSEPLIQCQQCGYWSHKNCEKLEYGANPKQFKCSQCGTLSYEIPDIKFSPDDPVPNSYVTIDIDRDEIINSLPNGLFQQIISEELQNTQISFRKIIEKNFHYFASLLFERVHEFWRVFVDTLCKILGCDKKILLDAIDILSSKLLYKPNSVINDMIISSYFYEHSHSIDEYLSTVQAPKYSKQKEFVRLYKGEDGGIYTPVGLEDGALITVLPGLLMHTEEVQCEEGIPLTTLTITDDLVVIDTYGTNFTFTPIIRRSFHFNTILKLIRFNGEIRVGMFATRMKGPLNEEKSRRGFAIPPNMEIILPFDGDIPYPLPKCYWKDKKRHTHTLSDVKDEPVKNKQTIQTRSKKKNNKVGDDLIINMAKNENAINGLTLLSSFTDEVTTAIPFILLPDDETVAKYKAIKETKERVRGRRGRYPSNHNIS